MMQTYGGSYFGDSGPDPIRPPAPPLALCVPCGWQGDAWDLVVNLNGTGRPVLTCPVCARDEALELDLDLDETDMDGIDLSDLPAPTGRSMQLEDN